MQQPPSTDSPHGSTTLFTQNPPTLTVHTPSTIDVSTFSGSSFSTAQPLPATAQSGHAYIATRGKGLDVDSKIKLKTRVGPSTASEPPPKEKKKGFFSHWTRKNQRKDKGEDEEDGREGEAKKKEQQGGAFRCGLKPKLRLPPKAARLIGRVLGGKADGKKGQAGMKWEHFVKVWPLWFSFDALALHAPRLTVNRSSGDEVAWVPSSHKHGGLQCAL